MLQAARSLYKEAIRLGLTFQDLNSVQATFAINEADFLDVLQEEIEDHPDLEFYEHLALNVSENEG